MTLDLDWASIRPLGGSKRDGFEELCTQVAQACSPAEAEFVRKGRPDSGVEAFVVHPDGTEWAWQSKYFHSMGVSQWAQLDESVETALTGHPRLTRFIICIPVDLADGRSGSSKSARQRWGERVAKWSSWATRKGMTVEFTWQGSHEMLTELVKPQHEGLVQFFFGNRYLDDTWFRCRLGEALQAAGPRYTPELNVKLSLSTQFDALGRSREFFDRIRSKASGIRERIRSHAFSVTRNPDPILSDMLSAAQLACNRALEEFKCLSEDPIRSDSLGGLHSALRNAARSTTDALSELRRQREEAKAVHTTVGSSSVLERDEEGDSYALRELRSDLGDALSQVNHFRGIANSNLVILTGEAGSGKTHLLCDLAKHRLDKGLPTVILMGQRFLDTSDPWTQALQQLDLAGWTAREFVKALEVVARRANSKLLLVIDAINEGAGRYLWPVHLSSFLDRLRVSPWISTVISVRSSHAKDLLPDDSAQNAVWLEHRGFESLEFDATRTFFEHYGIDLPSTPLLAPEFRNPLYLKTLCQGLRASGENRLPRGFHGVVKAFNLYISGVNVKVAKELDFNVRSCLVAEALKSLAQQMVEARRPWLRYEHAETIVNALLPGRGYSQSLMAKLFGEGLLIEQNAWSDTESRIVSVVQIAYERLSDYLCVEALLAGRLRAGDVLSAFKPGGPLDLKALRTIWRRPGVHEALHILVAERTGRELIELVPQLVEEHFTARVFLNSLVWRDPAAVTVQSVAYLQRLKESNGVDVIDTLVTLASIPDHPLNAKFTDSLLRETSMADRDAWWTVGLHSLWGNQSAVDRLIQWANRLWPHTRLADEPTELAATITAWLLTSSNRFLRDHATKALVSVLTWRPHVIGKLIKRFADLDDAYVAERILAAAYGAAMRTTDAAGVAAIANIVHAAVFASGRPRPHLLLREYARGIIKRAVYLGAMASLPNMDPPYASDWPLIPSESDLELIAPSWTVDTAKRFSWGHHRIRSSVMDDDFGRYVIGTNSWSTNWLSIRLDEPQWMCLERRIERAVSMLKKEERKGWEIFEEAAKSASLARYDRRWSNGATRGEPLDDDGSRAPSRAEQVVAEIKSRLLEWFGDKKRKVFAPLMDEICSEIPMRQPPKFDLKLVQRYVLGRVFELGWTSERFDKFDMDIKASGREAAKSERIGKKYQWIAYHEMLAFMADHYQYVAGPSSKEVGGAYQGSWQDDVRDIDPSNVMQVPLHDEDAAARTSGFWVPVGVSDWSAGEAAEAWANMTGDVPMPVDILFSCDEPSESDWVNLHMSIKWTMPRPAYEDAYRDGRREIWVHVDGALMKRSDVGKLKSKEFVRSIAGRGVQDNGLHEIFLGEIGWSEASKHFHDPYYAHLGWAGDANRIGVKAIAASQGYSRERGSFDCSVTSESIALRAPTEKMLTLLGAEWSGIAATYVDTRGAVVAFDPSVNVPGPSAFLVQRANLAKVLQAQDLAVCWLIQGEKTDAEGSPNYRVKARRSFHGIFIWDGLNIVGKYAFDEVELPSQEN